MIYVDALFQAPHRVGRFPAGTLWCHMFADSVDELHEFAGRIGMKRVWFQDKVNFPHYDLVASRRQAAVELGAIEVDSRAAVAHMRKLQEQANK